MKLLDYWALYLYHFVYYLKKDDTTWLSARIYLSMFVFALLMDVFSTVCLIMINLNICEEFIAFVRLNIDYIWMVLGVLCGSYVISYYRKDEHVERIERSYNALTKKQRWTVKIFIYFLEIVSPVYLFVCLRLVLLGQVKWWD